MKILYGKLTSLISHNHLLNQKPQHQIVPQALQSWLHLLLRYPPVCRFWIVRNNMINETTHKSLTTLNREREREGNLWCNTSGRSSAMKYSFIVFVFSYILSVIPSGAGPPFSMLYLIPKSCNHKTRGRTDVIKFS